MNVAVLDPQLEVKYEVLARIAEGGMGTVWKVRHRLLDQLRVVKAIRPPLEVTREISERFLGEARVASRLRHPNLAVLHDFAIGEDGRAFIVMEHIDGITLREGLAASGPPPLPLTVEIGRQAARALAYLHGRRIVHRDISPGNLMLTRDHDGQPLVKLIDLGVSKALAETAEEPTPGGVFIGKLRYAAPEQLYGRPADQRSDLYSLAVVLYELATGRCPVPAPEPRLWAGGLVPLVPFDESDPEGRVPDDLREVIATALAADPEERFQSAESLAAALEELIRRYPMVGDELDRTLAPVVPAPPEPTNAAPVPEPEPTSPPVPMAVERTGTLYLRRPGPAEDDEPFDDLGAVPLGRGQRDDPRSDETTPGLPLGNRPAAAGTPALRFDASPEPTPVRRPGVVRAAYEPLQHAPVDDRPQPAGRSLLAVAVAAAVLVAAGLLAWRLWWSSSELIDPETARPVSQVESEEPPAEAGTALEDHSASREPPEIIELEEPEPPAPAAEPLPVDDDPLNAGAEAAPPALTEPDRGRQRATPQATAPRDEVPATRAAAEPAAAPAAARAEAMPAARRPALAPLPPGPPGVLRPGRGVSEPIPLSFPRYSYPAAARGTGAVDVRIALLVDERGRVAQALVREGGPPGLGFDEVALTAARKVRFQPATRNDVPGTMWTELIFAFAE